jgi:hypothetical protein
MIVEAWDEYRGWAKRSRALQTEAQRWNFWSAVAFVATGLLGAMAAYFAAGGAGGALDDRGARLLACMAAIASAVSLYVGRQALAVGAESGWLRARATAEAIKSECFRFAAGVAPYQQDKVSPADALAAFIERRNAITARTVGDSLTPDDDPVAEKGDERRPEMPMTDAWYVESRINGQIQFYRNGKEKNERSHETLRNGSLTVGVATTVISTAAAYYGAWLAVWVAVLTTFGAAISAYGLVDRRKYLALSYATMKTNLDRLKERYAAGGMSLQALVTTAEDIMEAEHAAWIDQMTKTIRSAPEQPAPKDPPNS